MNILSFRPEPSVYARLKKPFDTNFHRMLLIATNKTLTHVSPYVEAVVTNLEVTLVSAGELDINLISYFTAHANKAWGGGSLLVFNVQLETNIGKLDQGISHLIAEVRGRYKHNAEIDYEMYVEEYRENLHGDLFPEYTFIPFEQTPEFYQKGIVLTQ